MYVGTHAKNTLTLGRTIRRGQAFSVSMRSMRGTHAHIDHACETLAVMCFQRGLPIAENKPTTRSIIVCVLCVVRLAEGTSRPVSHEHDQA
jgi:hypothetical protein